jgi:photosystem II stability/assembly factor-like uncharacterized protein
MNFFWHATNAPEHTRYDDIFFFNPQVGWGVNSAGQVVHTEDGAKTWSVKQIAGPRTWLRCMTFTSPTDGWVGSISERERLWKTQDGKEWTNVSSSLPRIPNAICGMFSPSKNVVYASGTQYPDREAAIMKTIDGGLHWTSKSMTQHANLLIDNYFTDDLHGWVVGGKGGDDYPLLKPVVLFTADGGETWVDQLQNSGIKFPSGEWGWKIQFLTAKLGFVSLESFNTAAILKTADGGQTWKRIEITDPQKNVDLEGIGFVSETVGWVGGWGHGFDPGPGDGVTSGTTDGGATWFNANEVGGFINRFRFTGSEPIVGYASGRTIYQCMTSAAGEELARHSLAARAAAPSIPVARKSMEVKVQLPDNAKQLTITIFDPRETLVKVLAEETSPKAGARSFAWDFKTEQGKDAGTGHFTYRVSIDGQVSTGMVQRLAPVPQKDLPAEAVKVIQRYAPIAQRSHDDLMLPDANGKPGDLKALFDAPLDLMAALIRGGWIIPGEADRSMFLVAIIGTGPNRGPMKTKLAQADVDLLTDWVNAGAVIPTAGVA